MKGREIVAIERTKRKFEERKKQSAQSKQFLDRIGRYSYFQFFSPFYLIEKSHKCTHLLDRSMRGKCSKTKKQVIPCAGQHLVRASLQVRSRQGSSGCGGDKESQQEEQEVRAPAS
jgi:hypothetical protein